MAFSSTLVSKSPSENRQLPTFESIMDHTRPESESTSPSLTSICPACQRGDCRGVPGVVPLFGRVCAITRGSLSQSHPYIWIPANSSDLWSSLPPEVKKLVTQLYTSERERWTRDMPTRSLDERKVAQASSHTVPKTRTRRVRVGADPTSHQVDWNSPHAVVALAATREFLLGDQWNAELQPQMVTTAPEDHDGSDTLDSFSLGSAEDEETGSAPQWAQTNNYEPPFNHASALTESFPSEPPPSVHPFVDFRAPSSNMSFAQMHGASTYFASSGMPVISAPSYGGKAPPPHPFVTRPEPFFSTVGYTHVSYTSFRDGSCGDPFPAASTSLSGTGYAKYEYYANDGSEL